MTLHHLEVFRIVYEEKNVTRAAERLHIAQPAISRAIQDMESYYGVRLFERMHRGVSPTELARTLYSEVIHLLDAFSNMERGLKDWDEIGTVRLGATISMGNFILPEVAAQLKKAHPHLDVRCTVANACLLEKKLMQNELDLAFIEGSISGRELVAHLFSSDRLVLAVAKGHPLGKRYSVTMEEIAEYPLLTREVGSVTRLLTEWNYRENNLKFDPIWESESSQSILQAVIHGLGVTFLAYDLVRNSSLMDSIDIVDVEDAKLTRNNYIVWHKNKFLTKTMKEIVRGDYYPHGVDRE